METIHKVDILHDAAVPGFTSTEYETDDKMVSHPPHYQSEKGLEVIDVIEAFNAIKYICRLINYLEKETD